MPIASGKPPIAELSLLGIGVLVVFLLAVSLPEAGPLAAIWACTPLVAVLPVLLLARTRPERIATLVVGSLTFLVSLAFQWALRANSDPFNVVAAWVAPGAQLAATIAALVLAVVAAGAYARTRSAAP